MAEGADRASGQLHGDKECPFGSVTKSGRVWRKVPESDARSVVRCMTVSGKTRGRKGKENDVVWQGMIGTKMMWYGKV